MIVLSPKNEYDSEAGYSLLRPFNIELVTRAISYLRKTGVLMRSKHRLDSRLPGRKFYIAQRFGVKIVLRRIGHEALIIKE